jgi:hypothetical protein
VCVLYFAYNVHNSSHNTTFITIINTLLIWSHFIAVFTDMDCVCLPPTLHYSFETIRPNGAFWVRPGIQVRILRHCIAVVVLSNCTFIALQLSFIAYQLVCYTVAGTVIIQKLIYIITAFWEVTNSKDIKIAHFTWIIILQDFMFFQHIATYSSCY